MVELRSEWEFDTWHGDILAVSEERIFSVRGDICRRAAAGQGGRLGRAVGERH